MRFSTSIVLSAIAAVASARSLLHPFGDNGPLNPFAPQDPYETFIDHFSDSRAGTETYLHSRFRELYANSTVTVTQSFYFDLVGYAAAHPTEIIVKPLEDVKSLHKVVYAPAYRRRDGPGFIGESVTFGGYQIAFGNQEIKAYVASWVDGFSYITQWHLISDKAETSKDLIYQVSAYASTLKDVILVFDQGFWRPDHQLWLAVQKASWEEVILDTDLKHRVQADYRSFFKSEDTYKNLAVPWKRGLIFLGPPGNGKTISLKAIMNDVKVPILYVKSLHSYAGDEVGIRGVFSRARAEAPCVLVMEDLDSLINDNNRSFFLNEVDGLEDNDGLLMIATTNHFDKLDPALSNRPSRFDRKYNFPDPSKDERRQYAVWWQNKLKSNQDIRFPDSLLDQVAERTEQFSFAYLKEAFVSTLLTLAEREDGSNQGQDFPEVLLDQIQFLRDQLDDPEVVSATTTPARMVGAHAQKVFGMGSENRLDRGQKLIWDHHGRDLHWS